MRHVLWILLLVACTALAGWLVFGHLILHDTFALLLVGLFFIIPPIGSLWMLYQSIRYERQSLPFVVLAFVPYAFLWYYFERYRKRTEADRIPAAFRQ